MIKCSANYFPRGGQIVNGTVSPNPTTNKDKKDQASSSMSFQAGIASSLVAVSFIVTLLI
jgi:hypothetical protein